MHAEVQDLCPVTWKIFLGNPNVNSSVYEDTLKIFPTRHQRQIPDWGTHSSGWVCIHKNCQGGVWDKTGIHHILQSSYFSHGDTQILSSSLRNCSLGTQDQKNNILLMCGWFWSEMFFQRWCKNILGSIKITIQFQNIGRGTITSDWQYIWTIARNTSTYQWHIIWRKRWIGSIILRQKDPNMSHIAGQSLTMEKYSKWHQIQTR